MAWLLLGGCDNGTPAGVVGSTHGEGSCSSPQISVCDAECQDGRDNDGDGNYDCADPSCSSSSYCNGSIAPARGGGGSTYPGAGGSTVVVGPTYETICNNDLDDDRDGRWDCDDPDCYGSSYCSSTGGTIYVGGYAGEYYPGGTGGYVPTGGSAAEVSTGGGGAYASGGEAGYHPPGGASGGLSTGGGGAYASGGEAGNVPTGGEAGNVPTGGEAGNVPTGGAAGTAPIGGAAGLQSTGGAAGASYELDCADGVDNDGDDWTDCLDPDCKDDPACVPSAAGQGGGI